MEELVKNALAFIPNYFANLLRLIQGPKRFVEEELSRDDASLKGSLTFFAISVLLAWLLESARVAHDELIHDLATSIVFTFALAAVYGAALCLAWRIVKGDAETKTIFLVHFYYAGVVQLLAACLFMAALGAMRATDPALYTELLASARGGSMASFIQGRIQTPQESAAYVPVLLVTLIGMAALLFWLWAGWGAYRQMNHLSKARSALAALLFIVFCVPVTAGMFLIATAGVTE